MLRITPHENYIMAGKVLTIPIVLLKTFCGLQFKIPLCHRGFQGDLGTVTHLQPDLAHRVIVRIKWSKKNNHAGLFGAPSGRMLGY